MILLLPNSDIFFYLLLLFYFLFFLILLTCTLLGTTLESEGGRTVEETGEREIKALNNEFRWCPRKRVPCLRCE